MNKKRLSIILSVCVVLLVVVAAMLFIKIPLTQMVSVRGYEINILKNWSTDSKGNLYNKQGSLVGSFVLIDNEEEKLKPDCDGVVFFENMTKYEDFIWDNTPAVLYYADNLKNPEPYGAQLIFFDEYVSERTADKIAKTFKVPIFGTNPPEKNISVPNLDNSVIKIEFEDKSAAVTNTGLINEFIRKQEAKEDFGINILSYKETDGEREISSWKYLESDKGTGYMYTYYKKDDGIYTYDNNAVLFNQLSKVMSEEESTTSYYLKNEDTEDVKVIEFPLNRYRDNAKELIALKTNDAKSADIQNILDKILGKNELKSVTFTLDTNVLNIKFGDGISSSDTAAYSYSAVIFSIAENVHEITISYADGNSYTFTKDVIDKTVTDKIDSVADDEKTFVDYTEKIEAVNTNSADGQVVYSGTVVISYNTMVTHPKTGEKVAIGPYAEERGYGGYLGRPISCVIRRSGSVYIATASCGGSVLASYPLENESRLNWAISMINAYS